MYSRTNQDQNQAGDISSDEGKSSGELTATDEHDEDIYVIIKGKIPTDTGIYGTWAEVAPKIHEVSAAVHKKCNGIAEAQQYLIKGGIPEEQTRNIIESHRNDTQKHTERPKRSKSRINYRALCGEKNQKASKQTDANKKRETELKKLEKEYTAAINKKEELMIELENTRQSLQEYEKREEKCKETIKQLDTENKELREQLKEA